VQYGHIHIIYIHTRGRSIKGYVNKRILVCTQ